MEFLENGLTEDHEILQAYGVSRPHTVPEMTSLAAASRLQNAIKYCTKVRNMGPAGQRVE